MDSLKDCVDNTRDTLETHLQNYGTNYRPQRAQYFRDQIKVADALLAKHREPA